MRDTYAHRATGSKYKRYIATRAVIGKSVILLLLIVKLMKHRAKSEFSVQVGENLTIS